MNYMLCCFNNQYTYIHTHLCVYAYGIHNNSFLQEVLQLFFLWCCVEIHEVAAVNCNLELQRISGNAHLYTLHLTSPSMNQQGG